MPQHHHHHLLEDEPWRDALHDIASGVWSGSSRAFVIMGTCVYVNLIRPIAAGLLGVHSLPEGRREHVPGGTLKVAVVGFGRTGTYSLSLALEELGFPTLHTIHLYAYENEEILHMLTDRLFRPAFAANEPLMGDADVQLIAESGYQAIADLPVGLFYEKILREFPDCKFILTTRENSEVWFQSWTTLTRSITTAMYLGGHFFPTLRHYSDYLRWLYAYVNKDASYLTAFVPKDHSIKQNAIATYEEHNRRVREVIPPEQLLEYSVKEGWAPLCNFLQIVDCPDTPFPKSNSGRQMRAQSSSAFWAASISLLFLINLFRKSMQRKSRKKID